MRCATAGEYPSNECSLARVGRGANVAWRGQNEQLLLTIDMMHKTQAKVMDKLVACSQDVRKLSSMSSAVHQLLNHFPLHQSALQPSDDRLGRLYTFLREELKRRGSAVDNDTRTAGSPSVTTQSDHDGVS